jgi:hypothetical protein
VSDEEKWIDSFVIRKGERIAVKTKLPEGRPVRRRSKTAFVMVPLPAVDGIAEVTKDPKAVVWLSLLFAAWEAKGKPFKFSNGKLLGKCSRWTKYRVLSEFEAAGWIEVKQAGKKAPLVTFLKW